MMIFLKVCVSDADGDNLSFAYAGEASIFAQIQDRTVLIASRTLASRWARTSESSQSLGPGFRALFRLRRSRRSHAV